MKAMKIAKTALWIAFLAVMSAEGMSYVAVVETEIDAHSGASSDITPADVRQVTAALRREAVRNLPSGDYNIMTSETVHAQGSATLEACAEENCVITLGATIGAEYIVRGIISKLREKFTLSVEMYETNDGNLVASSDLAGADNIEDLVKEAATVCADMYKKFAEAQNAARKPTTLEQPPVARAPGQPKPQIAAEPQAPKRKRSFWIGLAADITGAGMLAYGIYQDGNVKTYVNDGLYENGAQHNNAKKSESSRNIGYTIGSIMLLSGISVHIFF